VFRIREATKKDNEALLRLEAESPQGTGIRILIDREDYFYRSALFDVGKVLLAEEDEKLVGVMAYAIKEVYISGKIRRVAYLYDLRGEASYRRSMKRGLYRLWKTLESDVIDSKAAFIYGNVKADNLNSSRIYEKSEAQVVGDCGILALPSLPARSGNSLLEEMPLADAVNAVEAFVGKRDLRPIRLLDVYERGRDLGYLKGSYRLEEGDSFAQLSVWDLSHIYRGLVLHLPKDLGLLRVILNPLSRVFSLPRVPRLGEKLTYWHLFDPIYAGKQGEKLLKVLIHRLRRAAYLEETDLVNLIFPLGDPRLALPRIFPGRVLRYSITAKPFGEDLPHEPLYFDIRDF
jgi:hypothetical protein